MNSVFLYQGMVTSLARSVIRQQWNRCLMCAVIKKVKFARTIGSKFNRLKTYTMFVELRKCVF